MRSLVIADFGKARGGSEFDLRRDGSSSGELWVQKVIIMCWVNNDNMKTFVRMENNLPNSLTDGQYPEKNQ